MIDLRIYLQKNVCIYPMIAPLVHGGIVEDI